MQDDTSYPCVLKGCTLIVESGNCRQRFLEIPYPMARLKTQRDRVCFESGPETSFIRTALNTNCSKKAAEKRTTQQEVR
jgi:hypothetical protein